MIIDETSFRKRGTKSGGVGAQHCSTTGHVENCQVGAFLAYTSSKGCTLLNRELYLLRYWMDDRQRCREAGVPESVLFETKSELAERSEYSPVTSAYSDHALESEALVA